MAAVFEIPSDLDTLTPPQLTATYLRVRRTYRDLLKRTSRISLGSARIWVESNRLAYASVLFTRIVVTAQSIDRLLPDCKPREHWDFSAAASLTRNLAEVYLWYFWLCEDEVDGDVRQARFVLLYCHDHGSRRRLFAGDRASQSDDVVTADLIARFDANPYLRTFGEGARREALKGHKTPFVQDDVLDRMGVDRHNFRFYYRFFSQHTHSGPLAFFRLLEEHDRGTGVETEHEKRYMIIAMLFACDVLSAAVEGHLKLFPDAETRALPLTKADIVKNVERSQWRAIELRRRP